jgi:hypothetical protein
MTPSALTPAARGSTKKSRPEAPFRPVPARGSGHRTKVRRSVAPTAPRRVSGSAGGIAATAAAAGGVIAVPAPTRTPPARPARSAPSRPSAPRRSRSRRASPAAAKAPWRLRTTAYLRSLPDHVLLDRIVRGRVWIPLLGVLLAGIVAMQVEVLKLNAGIGRSLERGSSLQGQDELLRASVARLSDEQRIERIAAQMGMVMPGPTQLRFVHGGPTSVERALRSIHVPDATGFIARLPTIGAPAAPQGTSVNTAPGLTSAGTSGTASAASTSATGVSATTGTSSTTGTSGATGTSGTTSATSAAGTTSSAAGTEATGTGTPTGTSGTTSASGATSASGTPAVTPTSAGAAGTSGTTGQSGTSSSGGAGATPIGG